jgi:BirA family biotin operon repressor/biotin-[acetyl-CoA-carboxylase] ligase
VVVGDGKLAGVLVEAGSGAQGPYAVCGVGLNVGSAPRPDAPGGPAAPALAPTCLARVAPAAAGVPFEDLARTVRDRVVRAVDGWAAQVGAGRAAAGPLAPVLDEYFDAVPLLCHPVAAFGPAGDRLCEGVFAGIDVWGRATVHLADGRDVEYAAEQASLRPLI